MVLPDLYDLRDHVQADGIVDSAVLAHAKVKAIEKIDKYFNILKNTSYVIATVLDPRMKDEIFQHIGFTPEEKEELVMKKVRKVWEEHYKSRRTEPTNANSNGRASNSVLSKISKRQRTEDALDAYLKEGVEDNAPSDLSGILFWWSTNGARFGTLANMARDYLAIPATSADTERLFSEAKQMVTPTRANLSQDSISKAQLLKQWLRMFPEVIPNLSIKTT